MTQPVQPHHRKHLGSKMLSATRSPGMMQDITNRGSLSLRVLPASSACLVVEASSSAARSAYSCSSQHAQGVLRSWRRMHSGCQHILLTPIALGVHTPGAYSQYIHLMVTPIAYTWCVFSIHTPDAFGVHMKLGQGDPTIQHVVLPLLQLASHIMPARHSSTTPSLSCCMTCKA